MKHLMSLLMVLFGFTACGQAPDLSALTSSTSAGAASSDSPASSPSSAAASATVTNYLPDPVNPWLNGRWRAFQTVCGSQTPVPVTYTFDMVFTNGTAHIEMNGGSGCGTKTTTSYEVGYDTTALTVAQIADFTYNSSCVATQVDHNPPSYLNFVVHLTGATLSLVRSNNCDGHGAAYNTQYTYVGAQ